MSRFIYVFFLKIKRRGDSFYFKHKIIKRFNPIYRKGLDILLNVTKLLHEEIKKGTDEEFNKALLILSSKLTQHMRSVFILTERGLYGDPIVIIRGILSDINMIYYLHFHPELLDIFLKEEATDYQLNKSFNKFFNEGVISKDLNKRKISVTKKSFQIMSKASHASSFGAQLYGTRGKENKYYLKYGEGFEAEKFLAILTMIVSIHRDLLNIILWHKNQINSNLTSQSWKDVIKQVESLEKPVQKFSKVGISTLLQYDNIRQQAQQSYE